MKCDSQASLLARTFARPYLGYKPKVRVATGKLVGHFFTPNGITIQPKAPQSITKVVLYLSLGSIKI
jgi:hypothetical protein